MIDALSDKNYRDVNDYKVLYKENAELRKELQNINDAHSKMSELWADLNIENRELKQEIQMLKNQTVSLRCISSIEFDNDSK